MAKMTEKQKIGQFIANLRELRGWTQEELANLLETSQSSVARMEAGEQNFTTETLEKLGKALNHKILSLSDNSIDFKIEGGHQLSGNIATNYSKNGAMGLLCAALLNMGATTLHGIPRIEEVSRIIEVLESIGVDIKWIAKNSLVIQRPKVLNLENIDYKAANKTRTIVMFMGPLIHEFAEFKIPNSQGCKMGKRTVAAHIFGLEKLGSKVKVASDHYSIKTNKLKSTEIIMYESGDTACENLLMAASKIEGKTVIKYATSNYMVQDVCFFLQKLGVKIDGIGTTMLTVYGVKEINLDVEYYNSEDPIESIMFLTAGIVTKSEITVERCPIDFLELEIYKLEKMGLKYIKSKRYKAQNGFTDLVDITIYPSALKALDDKIYGRPYPGINIDNLPFFVPIATQAQGTTLIHDWTWENRAIYFMEMTKLGASMILADPHRIYIDGPTDLKAAQIVCPPALRPAMIILMGMLAANGTSILRNVYSIKRGYEDVAERLNSIGAKIKVISDV